MKQSPNTTNALKCQKLIFTTSLKALVKCKNRELCFILKSSSILGIQNMKLVKLIQFILEHPSIMSQLSISYFHYLICKNTYFLKISNTLGNSHIIFPPSYKNHLLQACLLCAHKYLPQWYLKESAGTSWISTSSADEMLVGSEIILVQAIEIYSQTCGAAS